MDLGYPKADVDAACRRAIAIRVSNKVLTDEQAARLYAAIERGDSVVQELFGFTDLTELQELLGGPNSVII